MYKKISVRHKYTSPFFGSNLQQQKNTFKIECLPSTFFINKIVIRSLIIIM